MGVEQIDLILSGGQGYQLTQQTPSLLFAKARCPTTPADKDVAACRRIGRVQRLTAPKCPGLAEPVKNQLITRVGWNEAPVEPVESFVNGSGKSAERVNGIVFVFAFNPVRHGLLDERAFVNSVHSVISFSFVQ